MVRRTVARPATVSGVTLFTGVMSAVTIRPASVAAGSGAGGIEFLRTDLPGSSMIRAHVSRVAPGARRTVLSADHGDPGGPSVQTVEHLLSALAGLGVTDALVEVDGPEVPIGDGSSLMFVEAIERAGGTAPLGAAEEARTSGAPIRAVLVREAIVLEGRDGAGRAVSIEAHPTGAPGLELEYRLDYGSAPGAPIAAQRATLFVPRGGPSAEYAARIAPARTFCLASEAEAMRKSGLFAHLTAAQMLVIGENGPIDNAYRFPDEPARHKVLDMLGDLSLVGRPVQARIVGVRTGHAHNHAMARALAALESAAPGD